MKIETITPNDLFKPIGPYSHIAKMGPFINISGTPGVDPQTGKLAGTDAYTQSQQILRNLLLMLKSVGATFQNVMHVHVFLKQVDDFQEMNRAYEEAFGEHLPARTVICVSDLPKKGALLTMNLNAILANLL
jgi:2-iminobutanoate/2-iminopropanoate deaminase